MQGCELQDGLCVEMAPPEASATELCGIYASNLSGVFEGPVDSLLLDSITNYWFVRHGNAKRGDVTKVILHNHNTR
jgi:hypothetical protein